MDYIGESISQLEHALQCAKFAADSGKAKYHLATAHDQPCLMHSRPPNVATGADEETVLGAMLHDVGHLQLDVDQDESSLARMGAVGVQNHEVVGASYLLRLGFSDKVAQLVCGHVQAKVSPASSSPSSSSDLLN
jgi:predicted HD phosphohydrolase